MQKRNMEVYFTTLIGGVDEDDAFLGIASSIERKIENSIGQLHTFNSSFSLLKREMSLKIDNDVEIIVKMTEFKGVRSEPITKMENITSLYEVTTAEMIRVYTNDQFLINVPEPMMYIHDCVVEFVAGACSNEKNADIARNLIDLVTQNKITIIFQ